MANPYALFMNLLPRQVKIVGRIVGIDENGGADVEHVSGNSRIKVKGGTSSYVVGDYVFVVDGVITSKLPDTQTILEESVL